MRLRAEDETTKVVLFEMIREISLVSVEHRRTMKNCQMRIPWKDQPIPRKPTCTGLRALLGYSRSFNYITIMELILQLTMALSCKLWNMNYMEKL